MPDEPANFRKHTFTIAERRAIFAAYRETCIYCNNLVQWKDFEVDHIINESLAREPERLQALIQDYGLPPDFSVNSFENWACSHRECNRIKGDTTFDKSRAMHFTMIAEKKVEIAKRKAKEFKKRVVTDNLLEAQAGSSTETSLQLDLPGTAVTELMKLVGNFFVNEAFVDMTPEPYWGTFEIGNELVDNMHPAFVIFAVPATKIGDGKFLTLGLPRQEVVRMVFRQQSRTALKIDLNCSSKLPAVLSLFEKLKPRFFAMMRELYVEPK